MKHKNIIVGILFSVGLLLVFGAVGQLDFDGINATDKEILRETIKALIGAALCGASVFIGNLSLDRNN